MNQPLARLAATSAWAWITDGLRAVITALNLRREARQVEGHGWPLNYLPNKTNTICLKIIGIIKLKKI